ncbi:MFS transporter small subunit [Streptomyces boninensis]
MTTSQPAPHDPPTRRRGLILFAWLWVGAPLGYGVYELVQKATQLFTG